jgi:organic hydroperoxide reductase OsmC/OhrA
MSEHTATITWTRREGEIFTDNRYSRAHQWDFDGGVTVQASSSPQAVRVPLSDPAAVDPEEAFVASLSSCHMLWFLSLAARKGLVVESYEDHAVGRLERNDRGKMAMSRVVLRPTIRYAGTTQPTPEDVRALHEAAHHECFIANSVTTVVTVEE